MAVDTGISKEQLQTIMAMFTEAVKAARAPNVLEEKQLKEEMEREKRKALLAVEVGKVEEEKIRRRKHGCSHQRFPQGHKQAGWDAPKGAGGEWCTSGQMNSDGTALTICQRCAWSWKWKPNYQESEYINNVGLLGFAPPAPERIIWEG